MAAILGGGGSRMTTAGTNSGCAACNPYPTLSCALCHRVHCAIACTVPSRALRRHVPLHHCCPLHATAASDPGPWTMGCHLPCPRPLSMHHTQPGPLRAHIAVAHVLPASTPLTCAHMPPLCAPHVLAPPLAPSAAVPHVLAPIACALASRAPSAAVPHVSAPVVCTLTS